jgi:hypothetical protein
MGATGNAVATDNDFQEESILPNASNETQAAAGGIGGSQH